MNANRENSKKGQKIGKVKKLNAKRALQMMFAKLQKPQCPSTKRRLMNQYRGIMRLTSRTNEFVGRWNTVEKSSNSSTLQ